MVDLTITTNSEKPNQTMQQEKARAAVSNVNSDRQPGEIQQPQGDDQRFIGGRTTHPASEHLNQPKGRSGPRSEPDTRGER